jgi:hypothetical protein
VYCYLDAMGGMPVAFALTAENSHGKHQFLQLVPARLGRETPEYNWGTLESGSWFFSRTSCSQLSAATPDRVQSSNYNHLLEWWSATLYQLHSSFNVNRELYYVFLFAYWIFKYQLALSVFVDSKLLIYSMYTTLLEQLLMFCKTTIKWRGFER